MATGATDWAQTLRDRLTAAFGADARINVRVNDAALGKFAVHVVSDAFAGKAPLARHRLINKAVGLVTAPASEEELRTAAAIHALEIEASTVSETATSA